MRRPMTPTRGRPTRAAGRLAVAAAALLSLATLTACRADQVGTAAIVDGDRISVEELQDATSDYLEAVPNADTTQAQHAILQQMIVSEVIQNAADSAGVTVKDGEIAAQRDRVFDSVRSLARESKISARTYFVRQLAQSEQPTVIPPHMVEQFIRDQLLAGQLGGSQGDPNAANEALSKAAGKTDIEVNPRYGRWDPEQGLAPLVSGGLSKTVDELTGDAKK
jgi:hypothetical protein